MPRLLLTEDDADQRQLYSEVLAEAGFEIIEAANGNEALEKFKSTHPEIVVLDIQMPGMDGIETLTKLLARDRQIPVVFHSAYAAYKANFLTWAADAFIVKSGNPAELVACVKKIYEDRVSGQALKAPEATSIKNGGTHDRL